MNLARPEKVAIVDEIRERIEGNEIAILTQYMGINVESVSALRKQLRDADIEYKVYKNTLARRALADVGLEDLADTMDGPTAWAFSKDPVSPAKILNDFAKTSKFVKMSGGILNGKAVSSEQLMALASLPSRDQLLAQVAGTVAAPLRNFVGVISAVPRNLVNVLEALRKKKEEGAEAA
jgi:large subunit ribosomal protein L10